MIGYTQNTDNTKGRMKNQDKKKVLFKIAASIVQLAIMLALMAVVFISFSSRIPFLSKLGFNFFAVTSGSMETAIPTGSLIYVDRFKIEDLKENDVITYRVIDEETKVSSLVTHRINKVQKLEQIKTVEPGEQQEPIEKKIVQYRFITKGDANNTVDVNPVTAGNIIGVYKWHIPKLGYISSFAQSFKGFLLLIILPGTLLIVLEIINIIMHFKKYFEEKSKKELELALAQLATKEKEEKKIPKKKAKKKAKKKKDKNE